MKHRERGEYSKIYSAHIYTCNPNMHYTLCMCPFHCAVRIQNSYDEEVSLSIKFGYNLEVCF